MTKKLNEADIRKFIREEIRLSLLKENAEDKLASLLEDMLDNAKVDDKYKHNGSIAFNLAGQMLQKKDEIIKIFYL